MQNDDIGREEIGKGLSIFINHRPPRVLAMFSQKLNNL